MNETWVVGVDLFEEKGDPGVDSLLVAVCADGELGSSLHLFVFCVRIDL